LKINLAESSKEGYGSKRAVLPMKEISREPGTNKKRFVIWSSLF
jgi:hypothetical protein